MSLGNRFCMLHASFGKNPDDDSFIKILTRLSPKHGIQIRYSKRWCGIAITGKVEM